ncbi:MAG: patatin-like phospholipase family protein [Candidatus Competibacterales bacterium]
MILNQLAKRNRLNDKKSYYQSLSKFTAPTRFGLMSLLLLLLMLVGCASAPERQLSRESIPYVSLPSGHDPFEPAKMVHRGFDEGTIEHFEGLRGHALNILQLSGGGQYGAFGAGFLKAWREHGNRPLFDIVTGVSTGALLSTHAFLGTPADDAVLEAIFTGVGPGDVFQVRSIFSLINGADAYYDTRPLQRLLDKHITLDVLARVAANHREGRRLYVGTTNIDYMQTWIWDMGAIAQQADTDALALYKNVLRASAAPPIAFPPVEIDGHLFVDGGVRQNIVVVGLAGDRLPLEPKYGPGNVYVINNGKDVAQAHPLPRDALQMAGPVINSLLTVAMDALLMRSYFAAKIHGYNWHIAAIPAQVDVGHNALAFDPQQMRNSFDAGYALAQRPDAWQSTPPVIDDIPSWVFDYLQSQAN